MESPTHSAAAVANRFLTVAEQQGQKLSPMKLQKLVYYAHGWHLGLMGSPLINEGVEAWRFGPVVKSLYHEFKEFGNGPIPRKAWQIEYRDEEFSVFHPSIVKDEYAVTLVQRIWDVYGQYTPIQLSNMTHAEGTPWHQVKSKFPDGLPPNVKIPDELIRDHFSKQLESTSNA